MYPIVKQYDQIDCGPACLLMILRFFGGKSNLVHLRELCHTSANGSTMLNIVNAARKLGLKAYGAKGEYDDLMKEKMPCIAHVILDNGLQHFVVVYKINVKGVLIGDPGKGLFKLNKSEFLKIWTQKAVVLFKPTLNIYKGRVSIWYKWIFDFIKKEESWIYQSLFLGIIYTALGLCTAVFIQLLIDKFIPVGDYHKILYTGLFLLFLLIIRAMSGYIRQRFSVELNKRISININTGFITHLFKLPKKFFGTRKTGDVTARINDTVRIQNAVLLITNTTIIDGLIILGSFIFIFLFSEILAWVSLGAIPLYGLVLWISSNKLKNEQNDVMKNYALVESTYIDSLTGIDEIFNFNAAPAFTKLNKFTFKNYQEKIESLGITRSKLGLFAELSGAIIIIGILIIGAIIVIKGDLLIGEMMAAYSLLANILPSVNRLVDANISLQGASVASQRLLDMLLVDPESDTGTLPFKLNNSLLIKNGSFAWPGRMALFSEINLELKKGYLSALWGISGSGKSTLVQIIQRKYSFDSGQILIDDTPANDINLTDFRKNISIVPQDIKIFNGTLAENIICGRTGITINQVTNKINELCLTPFLSRFDQGLFTILGEDNRKLSGGEKQIFSLIRALLEEPAVLIIDEGFSAIDMHMESQVFSLVKDYAESHTVLIISHNLKTIFKADDIHILHDGIIVQHGAPIELINEDGYFKNIWLTYQRINQEMIYIG